MLAQATLSTSEETDRGSTDGRRGAVRTCIATRQSGSPDAMIRFVVDPSGSVVPDLKAALPGRGAWVMADAGAVALAVRRKAFARAFKRDVTVGADLVTIVDRLLEERALGALSFANKAGCVIVGFDTVEKAIGSGKAVAVLHAREAAADGVRKLAAALRRSGAEATGIPVLSPFATAQMDLALGRQNVIHAALLAGSAGRALLERCHILDTFRTELPKSRSDNHPDMSGMPAQGAGTENE